MSTVTNQSELSAAIDAVQAEMIATFNKAVGAGLPQREVIAGMTYIVSRFADEWERYVGTGRAGLDEMKAAGSA